MAVLFFEAVKEPCSLTAEENSRSIAACAARLGRRKSAASRRALGSFSAAHVAGKTIASDSRLPSRELCEASLINEKREPDGSLFLVFAYFLILPFSSISGRYSMYGVSFAHWKGASAANFATACALFSGWRSVPAPLTQPPGQAMPSSR